MTLSEKILYCRRKAGLSQEQLTDIIGVSRQAISKWETGEAVPETGKLMLLAKTFGVTTDWLLSDADPAQPAPDGGPRPQAAAPESWTEGLGGMVGRLARRHGWLGGIYVAVEGLVMTGGALLFRMFINSLNGTSTSVSLGPGLPTNPFAHDAILTQAMKPVAILIDALIVIGIVSTIAGVVLAIYLRRRYCKARQG